MQQDKQKKLDLNPMPDPLLKEEWVKHRSKTHPGRTYYANLSTGVSVWNLTEAELAKSKSFANRAYQAIQEPNKDSDVPAFVPPGLIQEMALKRNIVNFQVQTPFSPPPPVQPTVNYSQVQSFSTYGAPQMNVPIVSSNPLVPKFPSPPISKPNYQLPQIQVRNYPPPLAMPYYMQQQMNVPNFAVPNITNLNIPNGPVQNMRTTVHPLGVPVQSTTVSISSRFKALSDESNTKQTTIVNCAPPELIKPKVIPELIKQKDPVDKILNLRPRYQNPFRRYIKRRPQRNLRSAGIKDLREILQAKRVINKKKKVTFEINETFMAKEEMSFNQGGQNERDIENKMTHLIVNDKAPNRDKDGQYERKLPKAALSTGNKDISMFNFEDAEWLKTNWQKNSSKLFVKPIKNLLGCNDTELWYVVADTNIFISDCYFLSTLVNSDDNCCLVVTSRVLSELERYINQLGGDRSQRAAAMAAAEYIESSPRVVTDKMLCAKLKVNVRFPTNDDQILDCVLRLSQNNFRVLLLSNDKVLQSKTETSNLLTFNVSELKKYLSTFNKSEDDKGVHDPISITFSNSLSGSSYSVAKVNIPQATKTSIDTQVSPLRNIVDSGDQTDFSPKHIQMKVSNSKRLVDKDVQTNDEYYKDDNIDKGNLKLTRKNNIETNTEPERLNRRERRSKWWSRRHNPERTTNSIATLTEDANICDEKTQPKLHPKSLHISPVKNLSNIPLDISQEQSNADSDDSFSLSKRFSGSFFLSGSSELRPRTVEESPTNSSDVIPNSRSSASSNNNVNMENFENNFEGSIDNNLFGVSDSAMEERLRTGSEEWTSRFLQIMEEVLTQVLRQNPLQDNPYSPPWTIHEATVCLRQKYSNNSAIVDAATLFSFTVFASSNKTGNIFRVLSPDRFMKLFSHGWGLVVVLHQVLSGRPGSEDLAIAKDSLTKLLSDIKGLNSDNIDHFVDNSAEECLNENKKGHQSDRIGSEGDIFAHYESPQTKSSILQNSSKNPVLTPASSDYVNIIRNININDAGPLNNCNAATEQFQQSPLTHNVRKTTTPEHSPIEEFNKTAEGTTFSPKTPETASPINEGPKIIRNFTKYAEFEERLTRKAQDKLDMDMLSYSDDEYDGEYGFEGDKYYDGCFDDGEEYLHDEVNGYQVDEQCCDNEVLIKKFLAEIKDTFLSVRAYCEQTYLELNNAQPINSERKLELKEQTEDMHAFLNSLLTTLNSILLRENTSGVNIEHSQFTNFKISASQCTSYSDVIKKCSGQVKILLDVLNSIMHSCVAGM